MSLVAWRSCTFLNVAFLVWALLVPPNSASANVAITINKASQRMSVSVDGVQEYVWPVSTGKSGYSTPSGSYRPFRMEVDYYSKEWDDAPMPYSIFFTPQGHAIHGSYDIKHLGSPVSHGCIRIDPSNAATLFGLVEAQGLANTTVTVVGADPGRSQKAPKRPRRVTPPSFVEPQWDDQYFGPQWDDQYYGEYAPVPPPWFYDQPDYFTPGWDFGG